MDNSGPPMSFKYDSMYVFRVSCTLRFLLQDIKPGKKKKNISFLVQVRSLCLSRVSMMIPNAKSHMKAHGEQQHHWGVQHVFVPLMGMGI